MDFDDYSVRILSRCLVPLGVSLHGVGDVVWVSEDRCTTFEAEPSSAGDLADRCATVPLDVEHFLCPVGRYDPDDRLFGSEGERDRDDVQRTIRALRRQRPQVAFGEKLDFFGAEFSCSARHGRER